MEHQQHYRATGRPLKGLRLIMDVWMASDRGRRNAMLLLGWRMQIA